MSDILRKDESCKGIISLCMTHPLLFYEEMSELH